MEVAKIAKDIHDKVNLLEQGRLLVRSRSLEYAKSVADYDKRMASVLVKLKNGVEFNVGGILISNPPATIMEKIAKGICYDEKLNMETCDALSKSAVSGMKSLQAELNGLQSIYKHLEEV